MFIIDSGTFSGFLKFYTAETYIKEIASINFFLALLIFSILRLDIKPFAKAETTLMWSTLAYNLYILPVKG